MNKQQKYKKQQAIQGKKINNFISFRTKQTIYLNHNLPQLIIHEQAFETDAFKQLLTKRSSSRLSKQRKQNQKEKQKQNLFQYNHMKRPDSQEIETHRHRLKTSKQKSNNQNSLQKNHEYEYEHDNNNNDKSKSKSKSTKKLTKKTKSMIRLIPNHVQNQNYNQNNQLPTKRKQRKSYSPNQNYNYNYTSTKNNLNINSHNHLKRIFMKEEIPTSFAKSTKFTQSKQQTKRVKSKNDQYQEKSKSKSKLKKKNKQKQMQMQRQRQKVQTKSKNNHTKNQNQKSKRSIKIGSGSNNYSYSQANLLNFDQTSKNININGNHHHHHYNNPLKKILQKQKPIKLKKSKQKTQKSQPSKKKSKSKSKLKPKQTKKQFSNQIPSHFQSANDNYHLIQQKNLLKKYASNRDSLPLKDKKGKQRSSLTHNNNVNVKKKKSQPSSSSCKKCIISSHDISLLKIQNEAATKIQKVYKGYVTRKCLNQYLVLIHATVTIQRFWRGYLGRKKANKIKAQQLNSKLSKIPKRIKPKLQLIQEQLLIESSDGRSSLNNNNRREQTPSESVQQRQGQIQNQNFQKLKQILFQVMDEDSVDIKIKSRIKAFLEKQQMSSRNSLKSSRSQSRLSSERLKQEMESEKKYFQKKQSKKQQKINQNKPPSALSLPISPNYFSSKISNSPYRQLQSYNSPKNASISISPLLSKSFRNSSDVLNNLFEIQEFHRQKLIETASKKKQQLNSMLHNMIVSPRTHKLKNQEVDQKLLSQLSKFQANISQVMQSCKKTEKLQQQQQQLQSARPLMITPQHISIQSPVQPYQMKEQRKLSFGQEYLQQQEEYRLQTIKNNQEPLQKYRFNFDTIVQSQSMQVNNNKNGNALGNQIESLQVSIKNIDVDVEAGQFDHIQKIDNSYNFVDQYLLTLIQFLRNKNDGAIMAQIVDNIKTFKTLSPDIVLRNLSLVPEEDEMDDAFALPLYKYLDDDKQLINQNYLTQFQRYFKNQQRMLQQGQSHTPTMRQDEQMLQDSLNLTGKSSPFLKKSKKMTSPQIHTKSAQKIKQKLYQSQIYYYYLKLLQDSFNEALNTKRPSSYIFTERSLTTINNIKRLEQSQVDVQSQYQIYCANAMLDIFCWFGVKYGYGVDEQELNIQSRQFNQQAIKKILKSQAQKSWDQYYQLLQIIATLSQQIWLELALQETFSILKIQQWQQVTTINKLQHPHKLRHLHLHQNRQLQQF